MKVIPSIDLKSGLCVRLYQGDYQRQTVYSDDPTGVALQWQEAGAQLIHLVDLDGAASGEQTNLDVISAITTRVGIPVQVGGGIRELETAERLLDMGVDRVVLGTAAVQDPGMVKLLCELRGSERVVVALDARNGLVAIKGWTEETGSSAKDLLMQMAELGVHWFLYTDISRDGTLTQPNFEALEEIVAGTDYPVLASGGITSIEHLQKLAIIGAEGAIIGSALYTGKINLRSAIAAVETTD